MDQPKNLNEKLIAATELTDAVQSVKSIQSASVSEAEFRSRTWRTPEEQREIFQFSLFMQLNEDEADLMSSREELQRLVKYILPVKDEEGNEIRSSEEKMELAFKKNQVNNFLKFEQFKQFMDDLDLTKLAEPIDRDMYRQYFRRNCCTKSMACCIKSFRNIRRKQVLNRLKKHYEMEKNIKVAKSVNCFMLIISLIQVFAGLAQLLDFYSDIAVLYVVYWASVKEKNSEFATDYQIALIVCFISLAATFMANQSCVIGIKFTQGDFEPQNFKKISCFGKLINIILLTFSGAFLLIPIELIDNLTKIFRLPGVIFGGTNGVKAVDNFFVTIKQYLTNLNAYQLISLEQQRRVTALLFENLPFTLLVFTIKLKFLNCHELSNGQSSMTINISLFLTLLQIMMTICSTWIESRWLKESALSYLMTKITANNRWIPYMHKIARRINNVNIHFGELAVHVPFFSHAFGYHAFIQYEFSDSTLSYLLNELKLWSSELKGKEIDQKHTITMSQDCLNQVSANMFIHFVHNFPENVFELNLLLDWKKFIEHQEKNKLIKFSINNNDERQCYSPTGIPLLQLCIENETTSNNWTLQEVLTIFLEKRFFLSHDEIHGNPMTVALKYDAFKSITIMNDGDYNFDFQTVDQLGISFLGHLVIKLQEAQTEQSIDRKLREFSDQVFMGDIDLHKKQFKNVGSTKKTTSAFQLIFKSLRHQRKVRYVTEAMIEIAKRQNDYALRADEKNTLFKNAAKLVRAYKADASNAIKTLGELTRECAVDLYTYPLNDRLFDLWPQDVTKAEQCNDILNELRPKNTKSHAENWLSKLLQQSIESGKIKDIFRGSIHNSLRILQIDSDNRTDINRLERPEYKEIVLNHLATAKEVDAKKFVDFMKEANSRMRGMDIQQEVMKLFEIKSLQLGEALDENEQDAGFQDGKFTRRKPRTGNLKRKVCEETQGEIQLPVLTLKQKQIISLTEDLNQNSTKKNAGAFLRTMFETVLEWIAAVDLITDSIVLMQIAQTEHHAWTTITVFSLLAPFFACQNPFLMFLREKVYRDHKDNCKLRFLSQIMVGPLMLIYLFIMDVVFLINQAILTPIIQILKLLTCYKIDFTCLTKKIDRSYELMFEMQKLEVAGFRRMRTISQLTFETFIQVLLQIRMLHYFKAEKAQGVQLQVDLETIIFSILLAFLHGLLEAIFLLLEAQASKTSFINYCMVCFNGRFGWVPYNDFLTNTSKKLEEDAKTHQTKEVPRIQLDFANIQTQICCFNLQVEFTFSNDSLTSLMKTLSAFPQLNDPKRIPLIKFGPTINNVSLDNISNLLRVCVGKVQIDLEGTDLKGIILKSDYKELFEIKKSFNKNEEDLTEEEKKVKTVDNMNQEDKEFIFELHHYKMYDLLCFILKSNEELLNVKNSSNKNLSQISFDLKDAELLGNLLNLRSKVFTKQMGMIENRESLTQRFINSCDMDCWIAMANNSSLWIPHQECLLFQMFITQSAKNPPLFEKSKKFWHQRFGPGMPQEIVNDVMKYESAHDFIKEQVHMYPSTVYIRDKKNYAGIETRTAYCFPAIRKRLTKAWEVVESGPQIDPESSEGTENNPLDISGLGVTLQEIKLLCMILSDKDHKQVKNLTNEQVTRLDACTVQLLMDTYKWLYVGRTRIGDQTGHQIECQFVGKNISTHGHREKYQINAGFTSKIDVVHNDQCSFLESIEVKIPETISFATFHRFEYERPAENTVMGCFIFQPGNSYYGFHGMYIITETPFCEGDPTELAKNGVEERLDTNIKPYYHIDSSTPGTNVRYTTQTYFSTDTTLRRLKITYHFDFPFGTDLDAEQAKLEKQGQDFYKDYLKSVEDEKNAVDDGKNIQQD